jgi:hypothetical protein
MEMDKESRRKARAPGVIGCEERQAVAEGRDTPRGCLNVFFPNSLALRPFHLPPPLLPPPSLHLFPLSACSDLILLSTSAMKALFNRFNRGLSKEKTKDPKDTDLYPPQTSSYQKEKLPQLPPLREWPPSMDQPQCSVETPTSIASFKPLPELSSRPLPPISDSPVSPAEYTPISLTHSRGPLSDVAEEESIDTSIVTRTISPRAEQDSAGRSSRKTGNGSINTTTGANDVQKKVAFISPAPTPTPSSLGLDNFPGDDASATSKSTVVRSPPIHPREPRGSTSTAASASRTDVGSSKNGIPGVKATTTRPTPSPYLTKPGYGDGVSIHQSLRSGTPFSQKSTGSVLPPASWSEGAEEDLVTHLGPRERTRQEVLWEIVASEER